MDDLERPLTVREFREFRNEVRTTFATKDDLKAYATKKDLEAVSEETAQGFAEMREGIDFSIGELRRHFDVVAEQFRAELRNLLNP